MANVLIGIAPTATQIGGSVRAAVQPIANALQRPCLTRLGQRGGHRQAERTLAGA